MLKSTHGFPMKRCNKDPPYLSLIGELQTILRVLLIVDEKRWNNVIVNLDSQQAITRILQDNMPRDANPNIITQRRHLLLEMHESSLSMELGSLGYE